MARPFSNASLARRAPVARARAGALYGIAFQSVAVTRRSPGPLPDLDCAGVTAAATGNPWPA
jgi:hypothetical protein